METQHLIWMPAALYTIIVPVPQPVHGGTYYHCKHPIEVKLPKYDKIGRRTGRFITGYAPCGKRFRREKTYRRHWRRNHSIDERSSVA
ncbi:MAG TPA: hypothetical protein VGR71_16965 [Nitrospira sp.]|nr:hypothetical protein [Nitrospira sp.]